MKTNLQNVKRPSSSGTYAGNDAANRAVPHGLGRTPSVVTIHTSQFGWFIHNGAAEICMIGAAILAVTAMDSTNFYVGNVANLGNSANASGSTYAWSAC